MYLRLATRALALCLLPAFLAPAASPQTTQARFESSLETLREKIEARQWKAASKLLEGVLEEHANQAYVLQHRSEIVEDIKRCLFWSEHEEPTPDSLVSGQIKRYSASTGQIKIVYTPETMGDFLQDSKARGRVLYHPAAFSGKHSIQVEGRSYNYEMILLAAMDWPDSSFGAFLGRQPIDRYFYPARILEFQDWNRPKTLGENVKSPARQGAKYKIRLTIDKKKIKATWGGKTVVEAVKDQRQWGSLGILNLSSFDKITLEGRCERSWIQGLVDQAMRESWEAFEEDYDPAEHVPAWLREGDDTTELDTFRTLPVDETPAAWELLDKALELYSNKEYSKGLEYAKGLGTEAEEPLRLYLELLFHVQLGNVDIADKLHDDCLALVPDFVPLWLLKARILAQDGDMEEAMQAYRDIITRDPELSVAHAELALLLLLKGRVDEARTLLQEAQRSGLSGEELDRVGRAVVKYDRGPEWSQVHEWKSKHYHVRSDIDKRTCRDAAEILEAAFNLYSREFREVELERRFDVYLFSGQASYLAYASELYGFNATGSGGFYTNELKQLLIWNLPQRDQMLRTIRHEGLHQYMDSAYGWIPRWLNEGLAEYFENADRSGTRWELGLPHSRHVRVLRQESPAGLEEFLGQTDRQFMARTDLSYAQSWALVHFLKHGVYAKERLIDRYFESVLAGSDSMKAFQEILKRLGWKRLDQALENHLRQLT